MILDTLFLGLPVLAGQFFSTFALLGLGVAGYFLLTPFDDRRLVREGNVAAGILMGATLVALAIPLAATLASTTFELDILIWGLVSLVIQLGLFAITSRLIRGLRAQIEAGNVAIALMLAGLQIAIALLNAGAMAG